MEKSKRISVLFLIIFFFSFAAGAQSKHHIVITVPNLKNDFLYLGNYYGHQTYVYDSARLNNNGVAVFEGENLIPPGIYFVLMPDKKKYFEILIPPAQQNFSITADTSDLVNKVAVKNSPDNDLFFAYNHFLAEQSKLANAATGKDSAAMKKTQQQISEAINAYRKNFLQQHPHSMLATIFKAMQDPIVPDTPKSASGKTDSSFAYYYFKNHYWDNINFKDSVLLRTPILEAKLKKYFTQLIPPQPDSIEAAADDILAKASANKYLYKYVLWWLTYTYESSPYMGMDAVFVHLVEKYYLPPAHVDWLTQDQLNKIISRAYSIAPNLIGQKAPDLLLEDTAMHAVSLYKIKAKYCLLVFWDPTCGHCIIQVPRMDSAYRASWKKYGVKMIGIRSDGTKEQWEDFIRQHHLNGWIHLWDPEDKSRFRQLYDVYSTPVTYLLDANKKIVAKRLSVEGISDFLKHEKTVASGHK